MNEEFLYYLWQFKLWKGNLCTFSGQEILVEKSGFRNVHAGPDFSEAKIRMGEVLWVGNVEIHTKTSDWFFHGHETDENYQRLILHVVWQHDLDEVPHDFPLVELRNFVPKELLENYQKLQATNQFIPCENLFAEVDEFTKSTFLEALFIERLYTKTQRLHQRLDQLSGDWEALTFERMAYVFGLKINAEAFEFMAKSFDFKILQQIIRKNENVAAFLFGQAGFIDKPTDDYSSELNKQYQFLKHKYHTESIENHLFKFLRLRPPNFPTIRLAQLSALYQHENQLFQKIISLNNPPALEKVMLGIETNTYWQQHYKFGKKSAKQHSAQISKQLVKNIVLNAVIPLQFLYGMKTGKENSEQIIALANSLKPETNTIIANYTKIGAHVATAMHSQAYLELYKTFCEPKKCVTCRIGNKIINHVR